MALGFLDVFGPRFVIADRIDAQADDLAVAFIEFRFEPGHVPSSVVQTGVKSFG
jgi:hypothetical protein